MFEVYYTFWCLQTVNIDFETICKLHLITKPADYEKWITKLKIISFSKKSL